MKKRRRKESKLCELVDQKHARTENLAFGLEDLMRNPGLDHISNFVFQLLDLEAIEQCRLVSKYWCETVEHLWVIKQLDICPTKIIVHSVDMIMTGPLIDVYPQWEKVLRCLKTNHSIEELKQIVSFMKKYYFAGKCYAFCGFTPLHYACYIEEEEICSIFLKYLKYDIDVNSKDNNAGLTPLQFACGAGNIPIIKALLSNEKIKVNMAGERFSTPFMEACKNGHIEVVKILIEKGREKSETDFNGADVDGFTALHYACSEGFKSIASLLLDHSTEFDFDVNATDFQREWTPLHFACKNGHTETVKLLLDRAEEKQIDLTAWDVDGKTPFQIASRDTVKVLMEYAADKGINLMQWIPVWPWN